MGVVLFLIDALVDMVQGAWKILQKLVPALGKGAGGIIEWIAGHTSDTRIELKPIKISLVAPSGFGKTTLLSTIMEEMNLNLKRTNKGKTYTLSVHPKDESDQQRLVDCQKKIHEAIIIGEAGNMIDKIIAGSGQIDTYDYEIDLATPDNKKRIVQPFCMMDIPGGWINTKNRVNTDIKAQWENFLEHLHESRILWIPIDAVALMETQTAQERALQAELMDVIDIKNLAVEWAQYRTDADVQEACICFVPVKGESYKLVEEKNGDFREKFNKMFEIVIDSVAKVNPSIKTSVVPVDTIGCIKKVSAKWVKSFVDVEKGIEITNAAAVKSAGLHNMQEKVVLTEKFRITGSARKIAGADKLLSKVYEYAYEQINNMEEQSDELIKKACQSPLGIIKAPMLKLAMANVKKSLQPLIDEFGRHILK